MRGVWRDIREAFHSTAVVVGYGVLFGLMAAAMLALALGAP